MFKSTGMRLRHYQKTAKNSTTARITKPPAIRTDQSVRNDMSSRTGKDRGADSGLNSVITSMTKLTRMKLNST